MTCLLYEPVMYGPDFHYQGGAFPCRKMAEEVLAIWRSEGYLEQPAITDLAVNIVPYFPSVEAWREDH